MESKFGDRLKEYRVSLGLTQDKFASMLGLKKQSYVNVETGVRSFSQEILTTIASMGANLTWLLTGTIESKSHRFYDLKNTEILGVLDFELIPIIPQKLTSENIKELIPKHTIRREPKGFIRGFYEDGFREGRYSIRRTEESNGFREADEFDLKTSHFPKIPAPKKIANGDIIMALEMRGDSMTGVQILDGDYVFFCPGENRDDGIHVLEVEGEAFVKRLEFDRFAKKILIHSENSLYPTRIEPFDSQAFSIWGKVRGWIHSHP